MFPNRHNVLHLAQSCSKRSSALISCRTFSHIHIATSPTPSPVVRSLPPVPALLSSRCHPTPYLQSISRKHILSCQHRPLQSRVSHERLKPYPPKPTFPIHRNPLPQANTNDSNDPTSSQTPSSPSPNQGVTQDFSSQTEAANKLPPAREDDVDEDEWADEEPYDDPGEPGEEVDNEEDYEGNVPSSGEEEDE